jgi:hypothetical protein
MGYCAAQWDNKIKILEYLVLLLSCSKGLIKSSIFLKIWKRYVFKMWLTMHAIWFKKHTIKGIIFSHEKQYRKLSW